MGNVLGTPGVSIAANTYFDDTVDTGWPNAIWLLGWNEIGNNTVDPNVQKTMIRDGNWDVYLGQQTWLTSAQATLPDSMYLTCKPAFFGSDTWPWLDPSTGTIDTLPAKARFEAGTPNAVPASGEACIS